MSKSLESAKSTEKVEGAHLAKGGAVVSDTFSKRRTPLKFPVRRLLPVLIVLVLVAGSVALGLYWFAHRKASKSATKTVAVQLKSGQALGGQVEGLEDAELEGVASTKTDPSKNLDQSYAKALALFQQGKTQEAIDEYKRIMRLPNVPYYIHIGYAAALSRVGDFQGAIRETETATRKVEADTSMDKDTKAAVLSQLKSNLSGYKDLAGQS